LGRIGARVFTRRDGWIHWMPSVGGRWTQTRDLRALPNQTFREWWQNRSTQEFSQGSTQDTKEPQ
jgi:L-lactate dehydrogenase complex protein LldF